MHPTLRIVALAAALSALAPAAFSAQVTLNFDEFIGATQPVEVGVLQGLQFRGAFGYNPNILINNPDPGDPDDLGFVSGQLGKGGFLLNLQRGQSTSDIIVSLAQQTTTRTNAAAPAVFFQAITFNLFTKGTGNNNRLIATGANGDESQGMTGGGQDTWSSVPLTYAFDPLNQVTSLRFTAGGAAFALDDMVVTLSTTTDPGGNVPEPASYGLVGLALLGAGAASRRKQRA